MSNSVASIGLRPTVAAYRKNERSADLYVSTVLGAREPESAESSSPDVGRSRPSREPQAALIWSAQGAIAPGDRSPYFGAP